MIVYVHSRPRLRHNLRLIAVEPWLYTPVDWSLKVKKFESPNSKRDFVMC